MGSTKIEAFDLADALLEDINTIDTNTEAIQENAADIDALETEMATVKKSVSDGKSLLAEAITTKGISTATDASFETMATNINSIVTLDSAPGLESQEWIPSTEDQVIAAGNFLKGDQTIKGDANLMAGNIKSGVELFGVVGNLVAVGGSGASIGAMDFSTLAVGDTTTLKHDVFGDIVFQVAGHDVDGQGLTTLVSKNIITTKAWNTKGSHYSASSIRSWLNGEFYNGFVSIVKTSIQPVSKITGKFGDNNISLNEPETTTEYCWLLSEDEIGVNSQRTQISEGSTYSIFTNNTSRIKYLNGTAKYWWLRSPSTDSMFSSALTVNSSGSLIETTVTDASVGVVVAICVKTKPEGNSLELATGADILVGKGAYGADGSVIEGGIPSKAAATITPGVSAQTIAAGQYLAGAQTIAGDANLVAANIAKGKSIFGVSGTYDPGADPHTITGFYTTSCGTSDGDCGEFTYAPKYIMASGRYSSSSASGSTRLFINCSNGKYVVLGGTLYTCTDKYGSNATALPSTGTITAGTRYLFYGLKSTSQQTDISILFSKFSASGVSVSSTYSSYSAGTIHFECLY